MEYMDPRKELLDYLKRNKAASRYQIDRHIAHPGCFPGGNMGAGISKLLEDLEKEGLIEQIVTDTTRWCLKSYDEGK